ncbi:hypothetical protein KIL84_004309 [Mauremys mutica]|uniref:Uncharacterized protein n=1 Tax=Mauremys mutica TaxID=74926 RepID=A0A9D4AZX0_9SAUR|nr:hypothetical protein KIL84_004309 [Mauremys mutica]
MPQCSAGWGPTPCWGGRPARSCPRYGPASGWAVHFPCTIAVFSPMASCRLAPFLEEPEDPGQQAAGEEEEEQQRTEAAASWEQPPGSSAEPQPP